MTPRLVMILGVAALISAGSAGAVWYAENATPEAGERGQWVLPGLADNVNDIAGVTVQAGARSIELKRIDDAWTVQPSGYAVEAKKLQKVLVGLVRLTKLEPRTASADKYSVLQVGKPGEDAQARQVTLRDQQGNVTGDIILGKAAAGYTVGSEEAQYVRLAGDAQSWLVRGSVAAGGELKDWVDATVMRINTGTVKQVEIRHKDGENLRLVKTGKDDKGNDRFEIEGLPDGFRIKDDLTVRYGATDLANVDFTGVRKATGAGEDAGSATLETDDGLKVAYRLVNDGGETWIRVEVLEKGSDGAAADEVSKRVDGWEFSLADYKIKQFQKKLSDFLDMQQ